MAEEVKIEQIPFSYTLTLAGTPTSGVRLSEHAPFAGHVTSVMIHWPPGSNALVDVVVGHGVTQFCPREGYLALDDATVFFPFNEWLDDQEELWVEMRNGDAVNPHTITVTLHLEGKR